MNKLNELDRNSEVWHRLKADLEAELLALRKRNDSLSLTTEQTTVIRAQIKFIGLLLSLDKTNYQATVDDGAHHS